LWKTRKNGRKVEQIGDAIDTKVVKNGKVVQKMVENKKNGLERLNKKSGKKVVQIEWKSSTKMVKR
jgi:hypothetical protein